MCIGSGVDWEEPIPIGAQFCEAGCSGCLISCNSQVVWEGGYKPMVGVEHCQIGYSAILPWLHEPMEGDNFGMCRVCFISDDSLGKVIEGRELDGHSSSR